MVFRNTYFLPIVFYFFVVWKIHVSFEHISYIWKIHVSFEHISYKQIKTSLYIMQYTAVDRISGTISLIFIISMYQAGEKYEDHNCECH